MNRTQIAIAVAVAVALAVLAFQIGRSVEGSPPIAQRSALKPVATPAAPASSEKVNSIFVTDIANVPFADLYDVLRSGKAEDRANWLAQLEALPKGPKKFVAISSFFKTLVQLDAEEALKLLPQIHDRYLSQIASDAMFHAAPTSAMPQLAEFYVLNDYRKTGISSNLYGSIEDWSQVDPVAVSEFFDAHAGDDRLESCFDTLLYQWARLDPQAALKWFQRQKPFSDTDLGKDHYTEAIDSFVFGWFEKDRPAALNFAVSNASNEAFNKTINTLALSQFLKSAQDATKFIERLPSASLQAKAVDNVITYTTTGVFLGYQDPKNKRSAETMLKWIVTLPEDARSDELGALAGIWEEENSGAFSAWFAQQSPQIKNRIVYDHCTSSDHENPGKVLEQASNITDPQLREEAIEDWASSFGSTADESIKLIRKTSLAENQKAYLIRLVRQHAEENDEE